LLYSYTDYVSLLYMEDMLAAWLYSICRIFNYAGNAVWLARKLCWFVIWILYIS
jgi:hypothetical protein